MKASRSRWYKTLPGISAFPRPLERSGGQELRPAPSSGEAVSD